MRGPLVLVATALLGGAAFLGFSRYSASPPAAASTAVAPGAAMTAAVDPSLPAVKVYKSATCGCCADWIAHLQENGFAVRLSTPTTWLP